MRVGVVIVVAGIVALTACSPPPSPAPTVTVTVTESAAPLPPTIQARSSDSPIDAFDAWQFCRAEFWAYVSGVRPPFEGMVANEFDAGLIQDVDGVYTVTIKGAVGEPDSSHCVVAGTAGSPELVDWRFPN